MIVSVASRNPQGLLKILCCRIAVPCPVPVLVLHNGPCYYPHGNGEGLSDHQEDNGQEAGHHIVPAHHKAGTEEGCVVPEMLMRLDLVSTFSQRLVVGRREEEDEEGSRTRRAEVVPVAGKEETQGGCQ